MNIISSVPVNVQPTVEKLHRIYIQAKDEQEESKRIQKFNTKIRIKSKSQGRLIYNRIQRSKQEEYTTVNLISLLKQTQTASTSNNQTRNLLYLQQRKAGSPQRQLLFLKQLINKRKTANQINQKNGTKSQSLIQSEVKQTLHNKQQNKSTGFSIQEKYLAMKVDKNVTTSQWTKRIQQYKHYDEIVKNLLSEMGSRKSLGKLSRPKISPNKNYEAKQKILPKMQQNQTLTDLKTKVALKSLQQKDSMVFRMYEMSDSVYQKKIISFIKFLYKVNYSNNIYADLSLSSPGKTYKVKVGLGNNCQLIKVLIKRRFWFQLDNSLQVAADKQSNKISFIWTQSTIQQAHALQSNNNIIQLMNKKPQQSEKSLKRNRKLKKIEKKNESFLSNEKILHISDIEQAQLQYNSLYNGGYVSFNRIQPIIVTNHIPSNYIIGSKKILFLVLYWYYENIMKIDPFTYLPKTYTIKSGDVNSPNFIKFIKTEASVSQQNIWIVKPGQNTNRGNGINVATFNEVSKLIKKRQLHKNGEQKTYIVQKYLKPFLYNGRKFDIRHYLLITSVKGNLKAYWYREGYIRTSSQKYDLDDLSNEFIHLTNDAIQKKSQNYGKYEPGNKLSYINFQRYLDLNYPNKKYSFQNQILNKMKSITTDLMRASFSFLDPSRKNYNFQLYGMDFMIDNKFQPYLIQVNANPCLQISCPVLERIIPTLVQHVFRLSLDPLFPPPQHYPISQRYQLSDRILEKLKFQLIFDEKNEGYQIKQKIKQCQVKFIIQDKENIDLDEQIFQNNGEKVKNFEID